MDVIFIVLTLLTAVVASSMIARVAAPLLPLPFVQIGLGGLLAWFIDFRIEIDPEVFLLLFIAPLLFLDGWRIPKEGLFRDKWTIATLALGLVLFTVAGAGLFIHWLIPNIPLAVAFALAAVLSPTDAVSVSAIAARTPIPKRLMHILEGESLLNDASGLVCMRFAVAAALSGSFSLAEASATFAWLATVGIAVGAIVAVALNAIKDLIARHFGEETGSQILISLLIPFAAYLLATRLQASGILAAVAAGVAMNYEELSGRALPVTRIRRAAVWDAIQFAGNGAIFVLLGYQLPLIVAGAEHAVHEAGQRQSWWLVGYVLAINAVLLLLRALWVYATLRLVLFREAGRRRTARVPGRSLAAAMSLAGVRGALTLSGVMTLPFSLNDGSPFPARDLTIFLAAGVIILSLFTANVFLPSLLRRVALPPDSVPHREEDAARFAAAKAAADAVERHLEQAGEQRDADLQRQIGARIIEYYRRRIQAPPETTEGRALARRNREIERMLRLIALRAERDELYRFSRSGGLTDELTRTLVREVDLLEARLNAR